TGAVATSYQGPTGIGPLELRPMRFPTGAISLSPEPRKGDVFYLLSVAEVPRSGRYAVRLGATASTAAAVLIDGVRVVERQGLGPPDAISRGAVVELEAGSHLVAVRVDRQSGRGDLLASIAPEDGSPSPIRFRAARPGDVPGRAPEPVSAQG